MPSIRSTPSTSSLQSTTPSVSSTMPLRSSLSQKDYSAAFGSLQSTYGMGVGQSRQLSSSAPVPKTKPYKTSKLRSLFGRSSSSSATPVMHSPENASLPSRSPKDYEAAFGALSSQGMSQRPSLPSGNWKL